MLPSPIMRMSCLRRLTNSLISNTPSPSLSMDRVAVGARHTQEAQLLIYKKYRHAHVLDDLGVGGLVVVAACGGGEIEPRDLGHVLRHLVDVTWQHRLRPLLAGDWVGGAQQAGESAMAFRRRQTEAELLEQVAVGRVVEGL